MSNLQGWPDFEPRVRPEAQFDQLGIGQVVINTTATISVNGLTSAYHGIGVWLNTTVGTPGTVTCKVSNASNNTFLTQTRVAAIGSAGIQPAMFFFPFANALGDNLTVALSASPGSAAQVNYVVTGWRDVFPPNVRWDGRPWPIGAAAAAGQFVGPAGGTLVAAPASPGRIMLLSAHFVEVNSGAAGISVTILGSSLNLVRLDAAGESWQDHWPQGLLLDVGTAVSIAALGTSTVNAECTYDLTQ